MPLTRRQRARLDRTAEHYEKQLNDAETPREKLWRACGWLVAESWRAGKLEDTTAMVLEKVQDLRKRTPKDEEGGTTT